MYNKDLKKIFIGYLLTRLLIETSPYKKGFTTNDDPRVRSFCFSLRRNE
jgi:hypothetical protein